MGNGPILDVVGKPEGPLTYLGIDGTLDCPPAGKFLRESDGKIFWSITDWLNNEIWYTERKQAGI